MEYRLRILYTKYLGSKIFCIWVFCLFGWLVVLVGCGLLHKVILRTGGPKTERHILLYFTQALYTHPQLTEHSILVAQDMKSNVELSFLSPKSDFGPLWMFGLGTLS